LAQGPQGLIVIDQHAAHERVLYESLKSREGPVPCQPLLFPRVVEVNPGQVEWVRDHLDLLAQAGLKLSPFGGAAFLLTAVPAPLSQADPEALVAEAVEALSPLKSGGHPQEVAEQTRLFLACRGAIKAGDPLNTAEIKALLEQLDGIPVSSHCPHGRPLWRLIAYGDLRHSFRRPR
jgi:DNA mismatch repair protein MutL